MATATAGQKARASQINAFDSTGLYSRRTGAATATASSAWTALPFATQTEGSLTGISVAANTTFTLVFPGVWTVKFSGIVDAATHAITGAIFGLFTDTGFGTALDEMNAAIGAGQAAGHANAEILTTGTATVVAAVFGIAATSVMATTPMAPRLTFSWREN